MEPSDVIILLNLALDLMNHKQQEHRYSFVIEGNTITIKDREEPGLVLFQVLKSPKMGPQQGIALCKLADFIDTNYLEGKVTK